MKTALKACSLEQEPHIIVVTPFIPLGAHLSNVFFNFNLIKNQQIIPYSDVLLLSLSSSTVKSTLVNEKGLFVDNLFDQDLGGKF